MFRTIHLIYYAPRAKYAPIRIYNKFCEERGLLRPLYRSGRKFLCNWPNPVYAPFSISYHLLYALKEKFEKGKYGKEKYIIRLYNNCEKQIPLVGPEDVILMHPAPDNSEPGTPSKPWRGCDKNTISWKILEKYPYIRTAVILPYTHTAHKGAWLNSIFETYTKNLITICGRYWTENWEDSPYKNQNCNLLQVNMAIDAAMYPRVKKSFNPKGKRKFLYIGHTSEYKNIPQLEKIAKSYENFQGSHIGNGTIKGWNKIANHMDLNPENIEKLAAEFDIFVNCSLADAQATTILEQMCLGFAVACTPQSGYDYPSLFYLDTENTEFNCDKLRSIQYMDEEELLTRSGENRQIAEQQHSWDIFTSRIIKFIEEGENK